MDKKKSSGRPLVRFAWWMRLECIAPGWQALTSIVALAGAAGGSWAAFTPDVCTALGSTRLATQQPLPLNSSPVACRLPPPALLLRGDSCSMGEAERSLAEVRPSSRPMSVEFLADLLPSPALHLQIANCYAVSRLSMMFGHRQCCCLAGLERAMREKDVWVGLEQLRQVSG